MEFNSAELWERIRASGLATSEECRSWSSEVAATVGPEGAADPRSLIASLLRLGKLNPFQLNVLSESIPPRLGIGPYRLTDTLSDRLGSNWFEAINTITGETKWCYQLLASHLVQPHMREWPPSLRLGREHSKLVSPHLDVWESVLGDEKGIACFADPVAGKPLSDLLTERPLKLDESIRLVEQIAQGLKVLHDRNLIHGRLTADHVWVDETTAVLRREILFPPTSPYDLSASIVLYDSKLALSGAAPEFMLPNTQPSPLTDLYALGVLWAQSLLGKIPWKRHDGLESFGWKKIHSQENISLPTNLPAQVSRAIRKLLAKNPSVRYTNAAELINALEFERKTVPVVTAEVMSTSQQRSKASAANVIPSSLPESQGQSNRTNTLLPESSAEIHSSSTPSPIPYLATPKSDLQQPAQRTTNQQPHPPTKTKPTTARPVTESDKDKPIAPVSSAPTPSAPNSSKSAASTPTQPKSANLTKAAPTKTADNSSLSTQGNAATVSVPEPVTPSQPQLPTQRLSTPSQPSSPSQPKPTTQPSPISSQSPLAVNPTPITASDPLVAPLQSPTSQESSPNLSSNKSTSAKSRTEQSPTNELEHTPPTPVESKSSLTKEPIAEPATEKLPASLPQSLTPKKSSDKPDKLVQKKINPSKTRSSVSPVTGKKKKKKTKPKWLFPSMAVGSVLLLGALAGLLAKLGGGAASKPEPIKKVVDTSNEQSSSSVNTATATGAPIVVDPLTEFYQVMPDDGKLLWAPPAAGVPHSIDLLPPGVELIACFSEAAWFGKGVEKVQSWLIESLTDWKSLVASYPFATDSRMKAVTVALYPSGTPGQSQAVLRMEWKEPLAIKELLEMASSFQMRNIPKTEPPLKCWSNGSIAIAFDGFANAPDRTITKVVIAPNSIMDTFAETNGGTAPVRRQLESLLAASDSRSDMFVLTSPSFLFGDGRGLWSVVPQAQTTLKQSLDDSIQSISVSITLKPSVYIETRLLSSDPATSGTIASGLRKRLEGLPDQLESTFVSNPVSPYWRSLATRFPQMLRSVVKNTRFGVEDGQVIANAYLPNQSIDNLLIASWMSLQYPLAVASNQPIKPSKTEISKLTIEEMLNSTMSLSFSQESLEMGLAAIATEFNDSVLKGSSPIEMTINGAAFQQEGITKNQQIRNFMKSSVPLREVLTELVRRANPVTTVTSPTEQDQKVVWLVVDHPEKPGQKKIELTTRAWAESNNAILPKEFVP